MKSKIKVLMSKYPLLSLVIRSLVQRRHFQIYCTGAAKTGTHSIGNIFSLNFRAQHEPMYTEFADILEKRRSDKIDDGELFDYFRKRDWKLWLECESSHPLAWFSDILCKLFKNAKFILTIRDCYSWLDSIINQSLNYTPKNQGMKIRNFLFDNAFGHKKTVLQNSVLFSVDGYLSYWADLNSFVLDSIPSKKLLIVPTQHISQNIDSFANFVGVPVCYLDKMRAYSHTAIKKHEVLEDIDKSLIAEKIESICLPVIKRLNSFEYIEKYDFIGLSR
jgi:hypothetical protein